MSASRAEPGDGLLRLSNMQKAIARTMTASKGSIPHFYMSIDLDFTHLLRLKRELRRAAEEWVTMTPLLVKAVGQVLREYPLLNAHVVGDDAVHPHDQVNMGVAVATKRGLSVPVVRDVNAKDLATVAGELAELAGRARDGRSRLEDLREGTFTLSNAGMFGASQILSIIKPPETAILSVGAVIDRPVAMDGGVVIRPMACAVLSADHRVADGAMAGGFLSALKSLLESEEQLSQCVTADTP